MNRSTLKKLLQGQVVAGRWPLEYRRIEQGSLVFQIEPGAEIAIAVETEPTGIAVYVTAATEGFGRIVPGTVSDEEVRDIILTWLDRYLGKYV